MLCWTSLRWGSETATYILSPRCTAKCLINTCQTDPKQRGKYARQTVAHPYNYNTVRSCLNHKGIYLPNHRHVRNPRTGATGTAVTKSPVCGHWRGKTEGKLTEEQWAGKQGPSSHQEPTQSQPSPKDGSSCHRHPTQDPGKPKADQNAAERTSRNKKYTTI